MIHYDGELYVPQTSVCAFESDGDFYRDIVVRNIPKTDRLHIFRIGTISSFIESYEAILSIPSFIDYYYLYKTGRSPHQFEIQGSILYNHTNNSPLAYLTTSAKNYNTLLFLYNHWRLLKVLERGKTSKIPIHTFLEFKTYMEIEPKISKSILFVDSTLYKAKTPYKSLRKELLSKFSGTEVVEINDLASKIKSHIDFEFKYKANDILSIEEEREELTFEMSELVKNKLIYTDNIIETENELFREKSSKFFPHKGILQQFIQSKGSLGEDAGG